MQAETIDLTVSVPTGYKTRLQRKVKAKAYGPLAIFDAAEDGRIVVCHRASGLPLLCLPDAVAARSAVEFLLGQVSDWGKAIVGLKGHSDELSLALSRLGA